VTRERLYKRTIAIREKSLGENHPDLADVLGNLADLYRTEERLSEAEPLFKRALAIQEKILGANNPELAPVLGNLGLVYETQRRSRSRADSTSCSRYLWP
jgi:tetratricopeptide (TPR) repeat protein